MQEPYHEERCGLMGKLMEEIKLRKGYKF